MTDISIAAATTLQREALESGMTPESLRATWLRDTDLVYPAGSTKLMLKRQQPFIQTVVQAAIENMRASLMFNRAFPDGALAFYLAKESLVVAADKLKPGSTPIQRRLKQAIQRRLEQDEDYLASIAQLVSFFYTAEMTLLILCNSRVLGSHICGLKSRIAAIPLLQQIYLALVQQMRLVKQSVDNCQIIAIRFRQ